MDPGPMGNCHLAGSAGQAAAGATDVEISGSSISSPELTLTLSSLSLSPTPGPCDVQPNATVTTATTLDHRRDTWDMRTSDRSRLRARRARAGRAWRPPIRAEVKRGPARPDRSPIYIRKRIQIVILQSRLQDMCHAT